MEKNNKEGISELNKLIEINNDRIEGYKKAEAETEDHELKTLFSHLANESVNYRSELSAEVIRLGGKPEEGTTTSGKFYRAWMDIKAAVTGKDRKAILSSCEYGEDVAIDTYKEVLDDSEVFSTEIHNLIAKQLEKLTTAHNKVKDLRDAIEA